MRLLPIATSVLMVVALPGTAAHAAVEPAPSTWVGTAEIESHGTVRTPSDGDLWPSCWAQNGNLYTTNGDGKGFSLDGEFSDIAVSEIVGEVNNLTGQTVAKGDDVGKIWNPTGLQPQADRDGLRRRHPLPRGAGPGAGLQRRAGRDDPEVHRPRPDLDLRPVQADVRPARLHDDLVRRLRPRRANGARTATSTPTAWTATGATRSTTPSPTRRTSTWPGCRRPRCRPGRPGSSTAARTTGAGRSGPRR